MSTNRSGRRAAATGAALALEGELGIFRAAELLPAIVAALDGPSPVVFDLSRVTEIDTAGLQLLVFARREARARGRTLELVAPSEAVADLFGMVGLAPASGAPAAGPEPARRARRNRRAGKADATRAQAAEHREGAAS